MSASSGTVWFWSDWLGDPAVRRLTPAERGVWIDLLALAATASPVGYVCDAQGDPLSDDEIARVTNASSVDEVRNLIAGILKKGAASRDRAGRLYNRRMVRKMELSAKRKQIGALGGKAKGMNASVFLQTGKQMLAARPPPHSNPNKQTSFFTDAARDAAPVNNRNNVQNNSDGRPATALPTGAPADHPTTERPSRKNAGKEAFAVSASLADTIRRKGWVQ